MGKDFKFLNNNIPQEPETVEYARDRFMELVNHHLDAEQLEIVRNTYQHYNDVGANNTLSHNNRPAVFLNLNRNRDTISDDEWNSIIQQQRSRLIEHMWQEGMILHTIVSQDENGFTLRTEINF